MHTLSHPKEKASTFLDSGQAPAQLALPTGPIALIRGRVRTDEDRDFLAEAFKVKAGGASATALYRCLAYFASLSERRIAYPSQSTMASYCDMGKRQVRRLLSKLLSDGWIVYINRKGGRAPSTFQLVQRGHNDHVEAPNVDIMTRKEGRKNKEKEEKALFVSAGVQTQDHGEKDKGEAVDLSLFPSLSQEQEKARTPVTKTQAVYRAIGSPKVVAKWCALRRKLGLEVNLTMETEFDKLPHSEKTRIINDLEARERELVHQGRVAPAPIQKPESTGYLPPKAVAAAHEALHRAACQHVPAADLPIDCANCGEYIGAGYDPGLVAGGGGGRYARA